MLLTVKRLRKSYILSQIALPVEFVQTVFTEVSLVRCELHLARVDRDHRGVSETTHSHRFL